MYVCIVDLYSTLITRESFQTLRGMGRLSDLPNVTDVEPPTLGFEPGSPVPKSAALTTTPYLSLLPHHA